jgi:hypothetical protein
VRIIFRTTQAFLGAVRADLARSHPFAVERVAFISACAARAGPSLLLLAEGYHRVADADYVDDRSVGAMMGQEAIRKALEIALQRRVGMFHVHGHEHNGRPSFGRIDIREQGKFVPDFFNVRPEMPHGAIVLSHDHASGRVWLGLDQIAPIDEFNVFGSRILVDVASP